MQSWTCPVAGTYKLEVWGAQAGYNYFQWGHNGTEGAQGGYATGEVSLTQGTTLYICVGGRGGQSVDRYGGGGGYNGGANGGNGIYSTAGGGSGGGGATHIALNTNRGVLSNYSSNQNEILVVAGGGGGSTYSQNGHAGGDTDALYQFGRGQNANNGVYNHHEGGGGGGGGWYGGQYGSDEAYRGNYGMGPAHGGSNYVKDSLSNRSTSNGGRSGNGFARITSVTRYYNVGLNILDPDGKEGRDGSYGYGYVQLSYDGTNWTNEVTNEPDTWRSLAQNTKIYIKYTRPFYNYLEFGSIEVTNNKSLEDLGNNIYRYTVTDNTQNGYAGGIITIRMAYKHTTLTLDPNGGAIDGNSSPQALSPQMQYLSTNWCYLRSKRPTRQCYIFKGWYDAHVDGIQTHGIDDKITCILGTKYFDTDRRSLCTEDLTVYAQWTENHQDANNDGACDNCGKVYRSRHKLTVNGRLNGSDKDTIDPYGTFTLKIDGRDIITATKWSDYIADGTNYTITPTAKTGYKYMGVTGNLSQTMPASDQTVRLSFDNLYTIVFNGNNATSGSTSSIGNIPYTTAKNLIANGFYRNGYSFSGWTRNANGTGSSYSNKQSVSKLSATPNGTVTLYAKWTPVTYHIYYTLYGSSATVSRSYSIESAAFTLPKPSINGYTFKGWIGGIDKKDPVRDANGKSYSSPTGSITIPKGTYGDYFFRTVFEKNHSVDADGNKTDDIYVAHSEAQEKQY